MAKGGDFRSAVVGVFFFTFLFACAKKKKTGMALRVCFTQGGLSLSCGTTPHRQSEACNKRRQLLGDLAARGTPTEYEQLNQPLRVRAERAVGTRQHSPQRQKPTDRSCVSAVAFTELRRCQSWNKARLSFFLNHVIL